MFDVVLVLFADVAERVELRGIVGEIIVVRMASLRQGGGESEKEN